ncbi:MAG: Mur ligase domain-containing protein, partial [Candidatus Omnitrophica bacterium]|nr:Mur ligase domain-containing protein [Candidatus Omnitrophota bacterium]
MERKDKDMIKRAQKVHLIGAGGSGLSGLAMMLVNQGKLVTGSDLEETPSLAKLKNQGVKVYIGHRADQVELGIDLVIYSQAVRPDNEEYKQAVEFGIPLISYPEALGLLMQEKKGIAIAGTHGKTTTAALIVSVLRQAGLSPSFVIGGEIRGVGNSEVGRSDYLIVEACEYKRSFLFYHPWLGVITNIEEDHLDYYQ